MMPKKLLRRYLPNTNWIRDTRLARMSGCMINDPNLWHLNKRSVSVGIAVGLFSAFMPVPGQMLLAVIFAIVLRGNLALAVATTWISNPFTYAPIFYFAYRLGSWITMQPEVAFEIELSLDWLQHGFLKIYKPMLTGCFLLAVFASSLAHTIIYSGWRLMIRRRWMKRRRDRAVVITIPEEENSGLLAE